MPVGLRRRAANGPRATLTPTHKAKKSRPCKSGSRNVLRSGARIKLNLSKFDVRLRRSNADIAILKLKLQMPLEKLERADAMNRVRAIEELDFGALGQLEI